MNLRIPLFGDVYRRLSDNSIWIGCAHARDEVEIQRQGSADVMRIKPATNHEFMYVDVAELFAEVVELQEQTKEQPTPDVYEHGQFHITEFRDIESLQDSGWQYIGPSPVITASGWHIFKRGVSK
jgi:hypothetical protein